jgi:hypothetical protein
MYKCGLRGPYMYKYGLCEVHTIALFDIDKTTTRYVLGLFLGFFCESQMGKTYFDRKKG